MWKICINHDTCSGRLGGHCTEAAFSGLPGVEIAAMSDVNPDTVLKEDSPIGAKRLYHSYTEMIEQEKTPTASTEFLKAVIILSPAVKPDWVSQLPEQKEPCVSGIPGTEPYGSAGIFRFRWKIKPHLRLSLCPIRRKFPGLPY